MRSAKSLIIFVMLTITLPGSWPESRALAASKLKVIRFGKVVDGRGKVWSNALIVVNGDTIVSVGAADLPAPADAEVIDLSRYTGIPGLIDVHTHMTFY